MRKTFFRYFFPVLFLFACSCSDEGYIQQILGVSVQAPVFLDCRTVSSTELVFKFSLPVRVTSLHFDPALETESVEDGQEVIVTFTRPLEAGRKFTADILVVDADRNSLNVIVPFRARNDRMPKLVFNELRTEYSKPKVEFVEFLALEPGNLGAMRLFIASNSLSEPVYEFSPADVRAGEYIVLHLRTVEDGCVDETGRDLALSRGTEAQNDARDFWLPGTAKMIHKTDILWIADQDDRIIDAVLLCEKPAAGWGKIASAAEYVGREGSWLSSAGEILFSPDPSDSIITAGTTVTRTVSRNEETSPDRSAKNWFITATNGATPGKKNSPKENGGTQNPKPEPEPEPDPPVIVETPVFLEYLPVSSTEIIFRFSLPVRLVSIHFDPALETASIDEGQELKVILTRPLEAGKMVTAYIHVEDDNGNSLSVIVPFRAKNDNMPKLVFNEIRTEYTKPKAEFVEFYALEPGNLGGLKLFIAGYSLTTPVYEFPSAVVKTGEYVVLHLRTIEEGCVNETGDDLTISGGTDAHDNARDFWLPVAVKIIHSTDALWIADQQDRIIDALLLSEKSTEWGNQKWSIATAAAAEYLGQKGAWLPSGGESGAWIPGPADSVFTGTTSNTRTICRDENVPPGPRADNWYITVGSGNTPGRENNPKRFNP